MSEADAPEPTSRFFTADRLRLHYVDWGNLTAPSLILMHGGRDHCRSWDWIANQLRGDFHVMVPDLRGHGDSQWSTDGQYSLLSYVSDLALFIDHVRASTVSIIGHSLGGNVSVRYAGLFPERIEKLVNIEGLGFPPHMEAERAEKGSLTLQREWIEGRPSLAARMPRRYPSVDAALSRMAAKHGQLPLERARHLTAYGLRRNDDGSFSWKFDNSVRPIWPVDIQKAELHDLWSRIDSPVLLAYGGRSWAPSLVASGEATRFRHARTAIFETAGHWVHHDAYEAFVAEAQAFLNE